MSFKNFVISLVAVVFPEDYWMMSAVLFSLLLIILTSCVMCPSCRCRKRCKKYIKPTAKIKSSLPEPTLKEPFLQPNKTTSISAFNEEPTNPDTSSGISIQEKAEENLVEQQDEERMKSSVEVSRGIAGEKQEQSSRGINIQALRRKFNKVFTAHYANLTEVLQDYWDTLKVKMYSSNMIGKDMNSRKCSNELLNQFSSGISLCDEVGLHEYCRQFIRILKELGGQPQRVAIELEKAWGNVDEAFLTSASFDDITLQQDIDNTPSPTVHDIFVQSSHPLAISPEAQCLNQYIRYLKGQYNSRPFPTYFKAPLIRFHAKHFINLALIESAFDDEEHHRASILMQINGHVDEIQKKKKKIRIDDIGRLIDGSSAKYILIEGAPGIGKTTFAWELCSQWANHILLQQWSVLILIQMRDKRIREAKTLADLLYHPEPYVSSSVCQALSCTDGKDVLLFFEGYDEVTQLQLEDDSIFQKLLRKELLPYAGIMVSSRPIASKTLCEHFRGQIQQHIQIVGFTQDDITAYIASACSENPKLKNELEDYLICHPFIYSVMYVPLYCSIITELYSVNWNKGEKRFAPKTLTDIYKALVKHLLQRHLELQQPLDLGNLPADIHWRLMDLGQVAMQGICKQQYIFDSLECDHLGMMQIVRDFYVNSPFVSYSFLHQTLQEFLAAFHITQSTRKEVVQILSSSNHFPIQKYLAGEHRKQSDTVFHWPVLLFTAGLTKLDGFPTDILKSVLEEKYKAMQFHPALLQLLFETQSRSLISSVFSKGKYLALPWEMTPLDWFVLGYCISNSSPYSEWNIQYELDHIDTLQSLQLLTKGVHYNSESERSGGIIRNISLLGANKLHQCIEAVIELGEYALDVTELTLGGDISPGGQAAKVLQQICYTCPRLVRLQLSSLSSFASWHPLFESFPNLELLERLELEASFTKDDAEVLVLHLKLCSSLKHLMIWFNEDSEGSYSSLITGVTPLAIGKLITLDIQRFAIDSNIATALATCIASNECTLSVFKLTETSISAKDYAIIIDAITKNSSLKTFEWNEFDVYGNLPQSKKKDEITDVHSNLCKIRLSSNSTFEGSLPLLSQLAKFELLETLKLSGTFSKIDVAVLCEQLQRCMKIKELHLSFMGNSDERRDLIKAISQLTAFQSLEHLMLQLCHFNIEMVLDLSLGLKTPTCSLNVLQLLDSRISSDDFPNLASAISENCSLKTLTIRQCGLDDAAILCLATALVTHPCIEVIEISENKMNEQTERLVREMVETKPTVKKLKLSGKRERLRFLKEMQELGYV